MAAAHFFPQAGECSEEWQLRQRTASPMFYVLGHAAIPLLAEFVEQQSALEGGPQPQHLGCGKFIEFAHTVRDGRETAVERRRLRDC